MQIRLQSEQFEENCLSTAAMRSSKSQGRAVAEEPDPIRTCFQRDRDRILHSKAFRRLMNKTQVFISPEGDHYRTRMTHTLEVSQVARTVARALRLNEDLTEAIALGHDVGHPPFGHAGEDALDQAAKKLDPTSGFKHHEQSVRVLTVLENLNLTFETLDGIGSHSKGRADLAGYSTPSPSAEAAVVRVADRIAYLNHDLDDAFRSGWLDAAKLPSDFKKVGSTHSERVASMVTDLIEHGGDTGKIGLSPEMTACVDNIKEFLFERFYLDYPEKLPYVEKAKSVVVGLLNHYAHGNHLPEGFHGLQGAIDYVSGMTDRFAIRDYERIFLPIEWKD
jgi:dGTPase